MTAARGGLALASTLLIGGLMAGAGCAASTGPGTSSPPAAPPARATGQPAGTGATGRDAPASFGVAGYVVPWDPRSRAAAGPGLLAEVSPVWYQPTDSGAVVFASAEARSSVATVGSDAAAHHVVLAPSISNFRDGRWDGALIARLVGDPGRRSAHVAAIVGLARSQRWPVVDIDYESLPAASRTAYSAFIAELARALHASSIRLSVTLHAKTAEPGEWSGAQAQDWRAIGAAADEARVMAYDYSYATSRPGPIAPPLWVNQVLTLATRLMPAKRVVLGVPTYGYDWVTRGSGAPVQWADVQAIAQRRAVTRGWDAASSSPWLRYTDDQGRQHVVWYEDARSLAAKLDVARRHGVTHVVLWRLGGEDPAVWTTLRASR